MFRTLRAILAQHRRLKDVEATSENLGHDIKRLTQAFEELRGDLEWLAGEVKSLRGRVTGGLRNKQPPDGDNGTAPPQDINAAIRSGTYRGRR